jgi:signal transduction histidine kinase
VASGITLIEQRHVRIPGVTEAVSAERATTSGRQVLSWLALLLGGAAAVLAAVGGFTSANGTFPTVELIHVAAGMIYLIVGFIAWRLRPRNRTGMLMTMAALAWFLVDLKETSWPPLFTVGDIFGNVVYGVIAQLGIAFPSGRLQSARERILVEITYVWVVVGALLTVVVAPRNSICACTQDLLNVRPDTNLYNMAHAFQEAGNVVVAAVVVMAVIRHRVHATEAAKRAIAPVIWASAPILFLVVALNIENSAFSPQWLTQVLPGLTPIAMATLPIAFAVGLARSRLASLGVGHLVVELTGNLPSDQFRDVVAKALGDDTLQLAYHVAPDGWVDHEGKSLSLPAEDSQRAFTLLERDGRPIAALIHDRSLENDPTLVAEVAAAGTLAVENERLKVELQAQLSETQESRTRLVEVADQERKRFERDLHDGAQQRLVGLMLTLDRARNGLQNGESDSASSAVDHAATEAQRALDELRELASGIRPAILSDAGLAPALRALLERVSVPVELRCDLDTRCSDAVEAAAYFAVSEALANVAKHARATKVKVQVNRDGANLAIVVSDNGEGGASLTGGTGLRGLADRMAALGGTQTVEGPAGEGTTLRFSLPCD